MSFPHPDTITTHIRHQIVVRCQISIKYLRSMKSNQDWAKTSSFNKHSLIQYMEALIPLEINGPPRGSAGKIVEIGAFDGLRASNSHFFETCLGWDGLLKEGNPINYQKVVSNRPFVRKMSFAPSCKENSTVHFSRSQYPNAGIKGYAKTYDKQPTIDMFFAVLSLLFWRMYSTAGFHVGFVYHRLLQN
ncbi:hypothetical protein ACHAWF_015451 [Thalassiosira exigua]